MYPDVVLANGEKAGATAGGCGAATVEVPTLEGEVEVTVELATRVAMRARVSGPKNPVDGNPCAD